MSQYAKIITIMSRLLLQKEWFLPQDFMQPSLGDLFVGYEASARLSELAKWYPDLIESERQGKYKARRINLLNLDKAIPMLPIDLGEIVIENYKRAVAAYPNKKLF